MALKKSLSKTVKTSIATLSTAALLGFTTLGFNSAKAQITTQITTNKIYENKIIETTTEKPASCSPYQPKYNTRIHYIINKVQKEGPYINPKTLDNIIDQSKPIVLENYKGDPYNTEQSKELMNKIGILINKKIPLSGEIHPCYKRVFAYLAVSEIYKLPVYPVLIPNHLLLRWDPEGIHKYVIPKSNFKSKEGKYVYYGEDPLFNKGDFNWDPNFLKSFEDFWYKNFFSSEILFSSKEIEEGIYLKNMNKKELLSVVYNEEGLHLLEKKSYGKALSSINKSIELNPKNIIAHYHKGEILNVIGKETCKDNCERYFEESIESYKKAQELTHNWSSFQPKYSIGIGEALNSLGKYEKAEESFNEAVKKDEGKFILERLRFYLSTNQDEKAKKDFILYANSKGLKIIEHDKKTLYIVPNKLRGQQNHWHYAKEKCKNLDTLEGDWRLPSIDELESIYKTTDETGFWFNQLWSSTEDNLSEKKVLIKDMETGEINKVNKNYDYYLYELEKIPINSVCIKTIEEWNIEKLLAEQKQKLLENNH